MCARPLSRATAAVTAARAGLEMSMKSNIKYTKNEARKKARSKKVQTRKREGDRANTSVYKLSSKVTQEARPQAKGSSFSPKSTSSRIRDPE